MNQEYMTGSQLRQYLHISTRKMKFLMDNNLIPHINTGNATHKYLILKKDAQKFKRRMENEVGFLSEYAGKFTSRKEHNPLPILKVTEENCEALKLWLTQTWSDLPEALPLKQAAELIGSNSVRLNEKFQKETDIKTFTMFGKRYCFKDQFIDYISSPAYLLRHQHTDTFRTLIAQFKTHRKKHRSEEFFRQSREKRKKKL